MVRPEGTGLKASGYVFWITGLSGAGKTTIARLLSDQLRSAGHPTLTLDGDVLRAIFAKQDAYTAEQRRELAMCYARMCREVATQGIDVVCATISMFHGVRRWNRDNIPNYVEVYLDVPMEELRKRDSKGLYGSASNPASGNVVGVDLPVELPQQPDIVIRNFSEVSPAGAVAEIWRRYKELGAGAGAGGGHSL